MKISFFVEFNVERRRPVEVDGGETASVVERAEQKRIGFMPEGDE